MSMMDPTMQQAMAGMVGPPPGGGGMPGDPMAAGAPMTDQDLLMLVLQLIASGQLSGPGVQVLAEATGGMDPMAGDPMAGDPMAADPMAMGMDPMAGGPMPGQAPLF
jgi:hypothetical protein